MHSKPVHLIEFNSRFDTVVSVDSLGMVEYWSPEEPFGLPDNLDFEMKSQTDLYEFRKVTFPFTITRAAAMFNSML